MIEGSLLTDTLAGEPAIFLSNLRLVVGSTALGSIDPPKASPWVEQRHCLELATIPKLVGSRSLPARCW
ncbi:hypothetical protein FQK07_14240 [Synechococcus sp. BSF8S]|uniref:hypothetical protein n=1 Tax=Synechococcales TaxID=1890424 RepID=UPI0016240546|nr:MULTISPECIES: hypothetical protein [unclassified Synechococcus]MBC1262390.1 hypothetical protein [Synechococcus sp. BSF8S]MBC1265275.1 hypothetical protein [Synechococcus sp. BSA11S]